MSHISKKPVSLPVRKRLKPTVNLNVACRRRKDAKDLPSTDATTVATVGGPVTKDVSSHVEKKQEDIVSLPSKERENKEPCKTQTTPKENENILNTSFESRISVSSSASTVLLQKDRRADHSSVFDEESSNQHRDSFDSGEPAKFSLSCVPTVQNIACRRRKDSKDLATSTDVTSDVTNKGPVRKDVSSLVEKQENNVSLPSTERENRGTCNILTTSKENENILNTSFESRKSILSNASTVVLPKDRGAEHTTSKEEAKKPHNDSFDSRDGSAKSISSSVSTVLLNDNQNAIKDACNKSSDMLLNTTIESEEEVNGLGTSDAFVKSNKGYENEANTHDGDDDDSDDATKCSESQQIRSLKNRANEQKRSLGISASEGKNVSQKSATSSIHANLEQEVASAESESVNDDDRSSVSEYSLLRHGFDESLPKYKRKISTMAKRLSEAKRNFEARFCDKKPERSSLRMLDLIYYNPSTNPMKPSTDKSNEIVFNSATREPDSNQMAEEEVDNPAEQEDDIEDNDNGIPAPRVKVGPNGEIILDEQSLVIETTQSKKSRQEIANLTVVVDSGSSTTYHTYSKKKRKRSDWTIKETIRFYKALQTLGTDFSLMQTLFPSRSRLDLKAKFKKEERINGHLIEKALRFPSLFDLSELEKDQTNEENKVIPAQKQKKSTSHGRGRKRSLKSLGFDEEDNGPALKKKKRRTGIKTLAPRNSDNDTRKEVEEREPGASSSDEDYQPPAGEQADQSECSNEVTERRSGRIRRGINGITSNYAALENKHDFLEAGIDLLESSETEEEDNPPNENDVGPENAPDMPSNFAMSNVQPGSLVIVTSQCPDNPGYQICNVFMVQEHSDTNQENVHENVSPSTGIELATMPSNVQDPPMETNESISEPS